ncbi:GvpL/GvpF family gas vesicle protein [Streptomyces sp. NL15-2K]|uniref:GvpL/GvpF family gas vesicle protein n=1 Tax=Streptomyces sp. NL15-2K TaxID=376149 RepID=UPI000F5647A9|nr:MULTISPECIES: GvpL/GvpF family gas vesicle protein [Actinomycetes]WKX09312.1 GvpL/GvpF family gas vesicle protein [Kutzneria buriramensis]GCB49192.1 gas vesicle synthesis protein [Streptomyces sp. NL15-2K]
MNGQLSYAYAVLRSSPALERTALAGVHGVEGAPVTLVHSGAVAAAVGAVPLEEFSEAALKVRLEDLEWLEATARAHHLVIETLAAHTTVLPLRLATVYLDDDRVREMLSEREEAFSAMLDRLADHEEWGVKVYAEPPPPAPSAGPADEADEQSPGRTYLRDRRRRRQTREDTWRVAEEAVQRTELQARGLAVERARHRPQQGNLAQVSGENVANDAYLVPRRLADEFRSRMLHAADGLPGVRVDVTGPWAPYSFAMPPEPYEREGAVRQ